MITDFLLFCNTLTDKIVKVLRFDEKVNNIHNNYGQFVNNELKHVIYLNKYRKICIILQRFFFLKMF